MANEKRLDLIDREKVYENACAGCTRHGEKPGECYHDEPCERLIIAFTVAEPVDAVEVVHGRWEDEFGGKYANPRYRCSVCKVRANYKMVQDELMSWHEEQALTPYCPNCGAKMDGDGNG